MPELTDLFCVSAKNLTTFFRSVEAARTEAEIVIFDVVGSVLEKVGLTGRDIDFLIINCRSAILLFF